MRKFASDVVAIADLCLGGLRGRAALVIGPEMQRYPYTALLQQAGMKYIYQELEPLHIAPILPHVQLVISVPAPTNTVSVLTAASIAQGCIGRHTPLLIFDVSEVPSVEEMAGLLPAVCLYTYEDLSRMGIVPFPSPRVKIS